MPCLSWRKKDIVKGALASRSQFVFGWHELKTVYFTYHRAYASGMQEPYKGFLKEFPGETVTADPGIGCGAIIIIIDDHILLNSEFQASVRCV